MIYQLPNGKIIEISIDQYFDMTDDDIEYFIAHNVGNEIENPFFNASFNYKQVVVTETDDDVTLDLLDVDVVDKLTDLDLDVTILEE